jgi:hypothetical protein
MAKSVTVIAVVVSLVVVAAAVAVVTPDKIDLRGAIAQPGDKISERPADKASEKPSDKPLSDRRWLAVAPGRIEPPSGMILASASSAKFGSRSTTRCSPASR